MAGVLGIDADSVVGKLLRVWAWFDSHTEDGNAVGVTYPLLDRIAGVNGFAEAMAISGWLEQNGHTMHLPNFDRHNGKTAKNRALTNERVAKSRIKQQESNADSNGESVTKTVTREEKRREEKEKSTAVAMQTPDGVSSELWQAFLKVRKAKKAPMSELALAGIKREADAAGWTLDAALTECITRGWTGFKADWVASKGPQNPSSALAGAI